MELPIQGQLLLFLYSFLLGLSFGAYYDIFRVCRLFFGNNKITVFIQDLFYFLSCAVAAFIFIFILNRGEVRFFVVISIMIGGLVYYLTLGRFVFALFSKILTAVKKLAGLIKNKFSNLPKKSKPKEGKICR